jgi:acyl-CoA synthetase (AMP-forming)/AMP-acid ligase II
VRSSRKDPAEAQNPILAAWQTVLTRRRRDAAILTADGRTLRTFAAIEQEAAEMTEAFRDFPPASVIGLQIGNHPSWPAFVLALWRNGLVPLPLGRHMEAEELNLALDTCGSSVLFGRDESVTVDEMLKTGRPGFTLNVWDGARARWKGRHPDLLKLTSGTTSAPRAVRFRASQIMADCRNICSTMGITAPDLNFGVIPISHSYGFSNLLLPLLCEGVPMAVSDDRMPRAILHGLAATGATVFPGMPVFYDKLAGLEPRPELPRLRLCISAGAPLTRAVDERFTASFGLKIHTFYGSSECGGIAYDRSDEPSYCEGSVGTPMDQVEVTPEPDGRIVVRGDAVGEGYYPDDDCEVLSGGRFIPGDLIDWREGAMYLAGRASDLINIAGRKLNPAEVEAQLATFPGVKQAVVFGVPSRLRGEEPVACLAGDGLTREGLVRFCEERLSQWQRPRDFWIVPEIVVNERGKISRRALAEQYLATGGAP